MTPPLRECPWCGPTGKVGVGHDGDFMHWTGYCRGCDATGPDRPTEHEAAAAWNARPAATDLAAVRAAERERCTAVVSRAADVFEENARAEFSIRPDVRGQRDAAACVKLLRGIACAINIERPPEAGRHREGRSEEAGASQPSPDTKGGTHASGGGSLKAVADAAVEWRRTELTWRAIIGTLAPREIEDARVCADAHFGRLLLAIDAEIAARDVRLGKGRR